MHLVGKRHSSGQYVAALTVRHKLSGTAAVGLLSDHPGYEDRERAAEYFGVSRFIIDYQLENHLGVSASW